MKPALNLQVLAQRNRRGRGGIPCGGTTTQPNLPPVIKKRLPQTQFVSDEETSLVYDAANSKPWLKRLNDSIICTMGLFHCQNVARVRDWLRMAPPVEWQLSIWNLLMVLHGISPNRGLIAGQIRVGCSHTP